jgi:glycosyltransferase involved in cell wall biosynthesis
VVTVVVCTRRRADLLARCLDALARLEYPDHEVLVVDNTPGDAPTREVAQRAGARYLVEPEAGLSRARNAGARAASGHFVAYTDDDATPEPDWLGCHVTALAEDPTLAATTGRVLPGPAGSAAAAAYAAVGGEDLGPAGFRVDRSTDGWFERANFGGVGVGPNMVFRRDLFERGWGFSERLGLGTLLPCEEHHAFYTLIRDGHAVRYLPDAVVHHDAPADPAELARRSNRILEGSSAYLVMLLAEERGFRLHALRYAAAALRGRRRAWRPPAAAPLGARRVRLRAAAAGPWLYARNRWRTRAAGASPLP